MGADDLRVEAAKLALAKYNVPAPTDAAIRDMIAAAASLDSTSAHQTMPCPCTTLEQDEDCLVGSPSLLCSACKGTGIAPVETVDALAAEMMKIAEQVDELEDPFAAWESIELLKSQNGQLRKALEPFARFFKSELHDLSVASDATIFAAFQDQATGAPLADLSIADVRRAYAALSSTTEGQP